MVTTDTLMKFGFTKDENNLKFKELFRDGLQLKEIHIDMYADNPLTPFSSEPFMLLLRLIEKNVEILNDCDRIIVHKNDTYFMNVLFSKITDCYYKIVDGYFEFILKIQNIYYRINVFN